MKPEAQRIAIAEACGKKHCPNCPDQGWYRSEDGVWQCQWCDVVEDSIYRAPNYLNDLNAMREAEKTLQGEQWTDYSDALDIVTRFDGRMIMERRRIIHATAAQRAEAFLRTLGKWVE